MPSRRICSCASGFLLGARRPRVHSLTLPLAAEAPALGRLKRALLHRQMLFSHPLLCPAPLPWPHPHVETGRASLDEERQVAPCLPLQGLLSAMGALGSHTDGQAGPMGIGCGTRGHPHLQVPEAGSGLASCPLLLWLAQPQLLAALPFLRSRGSLAGLLAVGSSGRG